jgi:putative tryptophan/tyrosine transport system substrate-binding protein
VRQGAGSFGVGARTTHVRDASELEAVISPQAHEPTVALIVLNEDFTTAHRMEIVSLATCYRLPPVYPFRSLLNSVASSPTASTCAIIFRRAGTYVDLILKGPKPNEPPSRPPSSSKW